MTASNSQREHHPHLVTPSARGWGGLHSSAGLLVCGLFLSSLMGCLNQSTRVPSLATRPAAIETRSWNLHDPFPDESVGPDTLTRPRSFVEPRRESYTSREIQFYQAAHGLRVDGPQYAQTPRNLAVQGFGPIAPPYAMPNPTAMSNPYGRPAWGAPTVSAPQTWQVPAGAGVPTNPSTTPGPVATTGPIAFQPEFVGGW